MSDSPTRTAPGGTADSASPSGGTRDALGATVGAAEAITDANPPVAPPGCELLEEVGRGGMGVVYRARDTSLNRDIAIKILRDRYPTDGPSARRFTEEAAITSQLQHPGIPPVHQVGTLPDGRPFLAMKLIRGCTLDDMLTERKTPAEGRGRFLAVFEQVCQAVGYAHAHHVIHRDLKPANVMVGAFGEVQVMDWGLAKTLAGGRPADLAPTQPGETLGTEIHSLRDLDSATQAGSILGTPAFMPPEQAGGEVEKIDARSDVFGLGALLCVILTGEPPYAGKDSEAVRLMAIRAQTAEALARLDLCGAEPELVALAKRCLGAEPADRPADAGEVAKAVAGFRAQAEERAKRAEIDRARAEVHVEEERKRRRMRLALAAALVLLFAAGGAFAWWHDHQETTRRGELESAREAVVDELARAAEALAANDVPAAQVAAEKAHALLPRAGSDLVARVDELREDLDTLRQVEQLRLEIADIPGKPDQVERDADWASRMAALAARYRIDPKNPDHTAATAGLRNRLAAVQLADWLDSWALGERVGATGAAHRRHLLDLSTAIDPDPWRVKSRAAARNNDVAALKQLARTADDRLSALNYSRLASSLTAVGAAPEAEAIYRRAVRLYPNDFWINTNFAFFLSSAKSARHAEAVRFATAAAAVRPTSGYARFRLGYTLLMSREYPAAEEAIREGLRLDPSSGWGHSLLGYALRYTERIPEAEAAHRTATRLTPRRDEYWIELGYVLRIQKRYAEAAEAAHKAVELNPVNVRHRKALVETLVAAGSLDDAESQTRKWLELIPESAEAWNLLARVYYERKNWEDSLTAARKAIELGPKHAAAHERAGHALWQLRRWGEAVAAYCAARDLGEDSVGLHRNLASAMRSAGERAEARLPVVRRWVELDPKNAAAHSALGAVLLDLGRWDEYAVACQTAIDLNPKQAESHFSMGESLRQLGDWRGAVAAYRAAIELNPKNADCFNRLGVVLLDRLGDGPGAAAAFRSAVELRPTNSTYLGNLASALIQMRNYDGAAVAARKAIEGNPRSTNGYVTLVAALAHGGRPAEGYPVLADALRNNPAWLQASGNPSRYNLACAAVLVGTGHATDLLPAADTAEMRRRALDWLRAHFADAKRNFAADPARNRRSTHELMRFCEADADLVGVRNPKLREKLPAEERAAWELFWHDVEFLRQVSYSPPSAPAPRAAGTSRR